MNAMFSSMWVGAGMLGLVLSGCGPSFTSMSAGQVGCMESDIEISDTSAELGGSETWVAACNGTRYVCSAMEEQLGGKVQHVSCTPEGGGGRGESRQTAAAPPAPAPVQPPKNNSAPPDGVAGFLFGKNVADASRVCAGSGHAWSDLEGGKFQCDGLPQGIGLEGRAVLSFCARGVCGIEIVTQPTASGKSFTGSFMSLSEALEKKYGAP